MKRRLLALIIVAAAILPALLTLDPGPARGQGPGPGGPGPGGPQRSPWPEKAKNLKVLPKDTDANTLRTTMVGYANALGVRCVHCHVGKADTPLLDIDFASDENPKKDIARGMMRMAGSIEEQIAKLGVAPDDRVRVNCNTCHRGLARPRTLGDEMEHTYDAAGADSALRLYAKLRDEYYGSGSYDFGESALNGLGFRAMGKKDVAGATAIFTRNLEKFPESSFTYAALGDAHAAAGDTAQAIADYEQALKLDPKNRMAQRKLEGLKH